MYIDSHQHFWKYDPVRDSWITDDMEALKRDFMPADLANLLHENNVEGCILVQASQSYEENDFLLDIATNYPFVKGVVGWVDLTDVQLELYLEKLASFDKFCGVRHILQAEPNGFLKQKPFLKGIDILKKYKLTYDILVYHHQLSQVVPFVAEFPNQPFVLDHFGKPPIAVQQISIWRKCMEQLAMYPNVYCKLSGLFTEAGKNWTFKSVFPYVKVVFDAFGVDRVMYGSDWPVCLLAMDYKQQINTVLSFMENFSELEKIKVMKNNAMAFYAIE